MAEEVAESAPAESQSPETPESQAPDTGIFPEKAAPEPEKEESAPSEEKPASEQDESASASEAANQERSDREKRIDESVKRLAIENRELKRQLRTVQQTQQQVRQPSLMAPPVRPKLEEFEDIAKYDEALEKWKDDDRKFAIQQDRLERERESQRQQTEKQQQELRTEWDKKAQRIMKLNPEFNTAEVLSRVEPSPTMDGWFVDSPVGPEMLNYFDENPDEADRIRDLKPFQAVRELVKLEEEISNQVKGIKPKAPIAKPPQQAVGRASAPAAPRSAADVLYG